MRPGSRWVYRETDSGGARQKVVVTVTHRTKRIAQRRHGARRARRRDRGRPSRSRSPSDYYAQDRHGNVWYLGEDTAEYEHGKVVSREGSFEAGVDGAEAGVIMPARPRPGLRYRQEHYAGHAEDRARIVSLREQAGVPFGHFRHVLMIREDNPLEPKVLEFKFYARGIGPAARRQRVRRQRPRGAAPLPPLVT